MRPVRRIKASEENSRTELIFGGCHFVKRDFVKPEPEGTIVLMAFRVTGYDADCDGSAMARLEHIDKDGDSTGWEPNQLGLYPSTNLVVTLEEWQTLFRNIPRKLR